MADPAKGEAVIRCAICGMPGTATNVLYSGLWVFARFSMTLDLCKRCVNYYGSTDRRHTDPLTVEDAA